MFEAQQAGKGFFRALSGSGSPTAVFGFMSHQLDQRVRLAAFQWWLRAQKVLPRSLLAEGSGSVARPAGVRL